MNQATRHDKVKFLAMMCVFRAKGGPLDPAGGSRLRQGFGVPARLEISNFKQPTAFSRRIRARGLRYFPLKRRGGRSAETALVRIAAPRGPPRGRADLRLPEIAG